MEESVRVALRDIGEISACAIDEWRKLSDNAVSKRRVFTAALSGGKTPIELYRKLAAQEGLPWDKAHIFIVDERFVPHDYPDSNFRMINENLLSRISIPPENVHPIPIKEDIDASADSYETELRNFFKLGEGEFPNFDLILLGMGEDGHTASLFPGDAALKEKRRLVVSVEHEGIRHRRVSITLPVINNARRIIFLVSGRNKSAALKQVINGDRNLPAALVKPLDGKPLFLTDIKF